MKVRKDLTGIKFGRLTVVSLAGRDSGGRAQWRCVCDCGSEGVYDGYNLKSGKIKSCGCLRKEVTAAVHRDHGGSRSILYGVWNSMKNRCLNPNVKAYKNYGARGIDVCQKWRDDFSAFRDWALASGYSKGLSLDRIDNDAGYCPSNCRWVTPKEQSRNRRANRIIDGKCLAEWQEKAVVSRYTVYRRLSKGWSIYEAISIPAGGRRYAT